MVFYRKYRPKSFTELIGQEHIKTSLTSSFNAGKLAHAYLFCGPRGTGKTSTARILAKMVNCHDQQKAPCNKCDSCISIDSGSNLDLIEIDAASNRGIEDIRSLRENIKLSPSKSNKKVYIIDEVHMLTTEAFNALLKTLEEPPAHAMFILATTDPQKIPTTILSRVQRLDFKLASVEELKNSLASIVKQEKLQIEDSALNLIAQKAQGSYRDGQKILDQISSLSSLDLSSIEQSLNSSSAEAVTQILMAISSKNPQQALESLSTQTAKGVSIKELSLELLDRLRDLILIKYNLGQSLVKDEVSQQDYPILEGLAEKFSLDQLIEATDQIQSSLEKLRYSSIPSLPLELALIESCLITNVVQPTTPIVINTIPTLPDQNLTAPETIKTDVQIIAVDPSSSPDLSKINEKWGYILETAKSYNYSLEALLRSAKIVNCEEKIVHIEVPYSFHQRMLEAPKSRDLLESILSDILEREIHIATSIGQRPSRTEDIANVELAQDDELVRLAAEIFSADTIN